MPQCQKCLSNISYMHEFLTCMECGYVDYNKPEKIIKRKQKDAFKGNIHFVKYDGAADFFLTTLMKVEITRLEKDWGTNTVSVHPVCPYCEKKMNLKYASRVPKKIKVKQYTSYTCDQNHRIFLSIQENYEFGWKE